jgi:hypothetical protein
MNWRGTRPRTVFHGDIYEFLRNSPNTTLTAGPRSRVAYARNRYDHQRHLIGVA